MAIVTTRADTVRANSRIDDADGNRWKDAMRSAVRDPATLCKMLRLPSNLIPAAQIASTQFSLFAPLAYVARMQVGNANDPLLRQVLPVADEMESPENYQLDPVGDQAAKRGSGLLQKYAGRVLIVTTGVCAVHCRYCFRRHFPYSDAPALNQRWDRIIDDLKDDPSITEVILSGGDPLTLDDETLQPLVQRLETIPHLRRLRIHTRLPIIIPDRVTDGLIQLLRDSALTVVMVVHANHANELDESVGRSMTLLADNGITLLNQAVLLQGVNDSIEAQFNLCGRLADLRVMPYYLHQLDRVSGAAHFETPESLGIRIVEQLRARLPGYAVPRFVREVPGEANKRVLA